MIERAIKWPNGNIQSHKWPNPIPDQSNMACEAVSPAPCTCVIQATGPTLQFEQSFELLEGWGTPTINQMWLLWIKEWREDLHPHGKCSNIWSYKTEWIKKKKRTKCTDDPSFQAHIWTDAHMKYNSVKNKLLNPNSNLPYNGPFI